MLQGPTAPPQAFPLPPPLSSTLPLTSPSPPPAPIQVALQKHMEGSAKQFATWRVEREKEVNMGVIVNYQTSVLYKTGSTSRLSSSVTVSYFAMPSPPQVVQLRRQNRRNTAHIQQLEALQAKQNAVLQVWTKV